MAWPRKMPTLSMALFGLAGLILAVGLGYRAYATFGATRLTGNLNSGGHGDVYEWHGERLLLQEANGRSSSTCRIYGRDGTQRSVYVPHNGTTGMFNAPDFTEVAAQPGISATIRCSHTVDLSAGESAVARARTVNSLVYKAGVPAVATIPVLAAIAIPTLRRPT